MGLSLKAARVNKGLTQEQAAKKIGVSREALSKWERGLCVPNLKYVPNIEAIYGVTYDNLIFLSNYNALSVNIEMDKTQ